MHRLAVYGWDDEAARLLDALQSAVPFRLAAVGDRRASALVRARAATGSPCYQHALEMFRCAQYDAALLTIAEGAAQAAEAAANAGAAVLLVGEQADGITIIAAAEAALHGRVPFAVLRPRLQQAGLAFLVNLAGSDTGWQPRFLDIAIAAPQSAIELTRDVIALANRLMPHAPASVVGTALGNDETADSAAIASELRYADGRLASLRARTGADEHMTLFADCPLGSLELRSEGSASTITMSLRGSRGETSRLTDRDTFILEAQRAARVLAGGAGNGGDDALHAPRDGSVLLALEQSLDTGQVAMVEERSSRANLVLIEGRGQTTPMRRGRLHSIGV